MRMGCAFACIQPRRGNNVVRLFSRPLQPPLWENTYLRRQPPLLLPPFKERTIGLVNGRKRKEDEREWGNQSVGEYLRTITSNVTPFRFERFLARVGFNLVCERWWESRKCVSFFLWRQSGEIAFPWVFSEVKNDKIMFECEMIWG